MCIRDSRKLDRKIMKGNRPNSKNKQKDLAKRRKEYEKITNQKKDIRNKIVNVITTYFKYVVFQDENIHEWAMMNHGKKIQNTAIGAILADLKHKSASPVMVDKFFPSTKLCSNCGKKNILGPVSYTHLDVYKRQP